MKIYVFIVFFLTNLISCTFYSCSKMSDDLYISSWIIIDTESNIENGFVPALEGGLVRFGRDSLSIANPYNSDITVREYKLNDRQFIGDSLLFLSIVAIDTDTMSLLSYDSTFTIKCIRLKDVKSAISESVLIDDYLSNSVFHFKKDSVLYEYYFDTINHSLDTSFLYKDFLVFKDFVNSYDGSSDIKLIDESWTIKIFYENIILFHTYGNVGYSDFIMYQILDQKEKSLEVFQVSDNTYLDVREGELEMKSLDERSILKIKESIIGNWKISKIDDYLGELTKEADSLKMFVNYNHITEFHKNRIFRLSDFDVKNNICISFNIDEYSLSIDGFQINKNPNWRLTEDGRYIKLNYGHSGREFLEIKKITNDEMIIIMDVHIQSKRFKKYCYSVKVKVHLDRYI